MPERQQPPFPFPEVPYPVPALPAEVPYEAGLAQLAGWWLKVECECHSGKTSLLPFRLLAARQGWEVPLSHIIERLKCKDCGRRPTKLAILDDASGNGGYSARKSEPLVIR